MIVIVIVIGIGIGIGTIIIRIISNIIVVVEDHESLKKLNLKFGNI